MAAKRKGIRFQSGDPTILLTASGQRMRVDGAATIRVEAYGISTSISALVSNAVQDEMIHRSDSSQNYPRGIPKHDHQLLQGGHYR